MPPTSLYWSGFPRYCLPRIRTASGTSITFAAQQLTAEAVFSRPLSAALQTAREQQQMKVRAARLARSRKVFPHIATYRRSLMGSAGSDSTKRQVQFVRRSKTRQPISDSTDKAPDPVRTGSRSSQYATPLRRPSPAQRSLHRRRRTSVRSRSHRSRSSARSGVIHRPSSRSAPDRPISRPQPVRKTQSHSTKPSTPMVASLQPAPYWGVIPSPASQSVRRTALENQTFVSRRVGGQFVHEPLKPVKSNSGDILQRGLSTSSRISRIYDKRLPTKGPLSQLTGSKYTVISNPSLEAQLSGTSLNFAKLDGSIGRSSPSIVSYGDEDTSSIVISPPSRSLSELIALQSFTEGLQAHLTETQGQLVIRTRSPSLAQTVGSAYTLQDLLPFQAEFQAAGLAVTSREQKGPNNGRIRTVVIPNRVPDQNVVIKQGYKSTVTQNDPAVVRRMSNAFPRSFYDLPAVASEAAEAAAAKPDLLVTTVPFPDPTQPPTPVTLRASPPKPIPRQQPVSKKILPWLKKSELKPGPLPASPYVKDSSPLSGRTSATTIIDFSPHPSEFWQAQGFDFDGFQQRHPNLEIESRSPGPQRQVDNRRQVDGQQQVESQPRKDSQRQVDNQRQAEQRQHELAESDRAARQTRGPTRIVEEEPEITMPIPDEITGDYESERIVYHDKTLPIKSPRITELGNGQEEDPFSTISTSKPPVQDSFYGDDRPVLARGDSVSRSRASSMASIPDFSGFGGTSQDGRPSPANGSDDADEASDEMMFKMDDDSLPDRRRRHSRQQYDDQRSKPDAKRITPWDFRSGSTSSEHPRMIKTSTNDPRKDLSKHAEATPPKLFGSEKLNILKTRVQKKIDSALGLDHDDDGLPPPIGPKQEVITKEVLPECDVCKDLGPNYAKRRSVSAGSTFEPKQGRSFLEWQAGVPFKHTVPKELAFEASLTDKPLKLPCGHAVPTAAASSGGSSSAPSRVTTSRPLGIDSSVVEQKGPSRRAVAARRKRTGSSLSGGRAASSIFTIQEAVSSKQITTKPPKILPTPRKPTLLSAQDDGKVSDKELLRGLGIVLEAVNNEDVDAWIKEVMGSGVRKFLADLSKMDKLGTGELAAKARRQVSVKRKGLERIQSMSEEGES